MVLNSVGFPCLVDFLVSPDLFHLSKRRNVSPSTHVEPHIRQNVKSVEPTSLIMLKRPTVVVRHRDPDYQVKFHLLSLTNDKNEGRSNFSAPLMIF